MPEMAMAHKRDRLVRCFSEIISFEFFTLVVVEYCRFENRSWVCDI